MEELTSLCYELLAKYIGERAWVTECFCQTDEERAVAAESDHSEMIKYRDKIEKIIKSDNHDEFIGLTE